MRFKIHCHCGTSYRFEVEPVDGLIPHLIQCPECGEDCNDYLNSFFTGDLSHVIFQATERVPPPAMPAEEIAAAQHPLEAPREESEDAIPVTETPSNLPQSTAAPKFSSRVPGIPKLPPSPAGFAKPIRVSEKEDRNPSFDASETVLRMAAPTPKLPRPGVRLTRKPETPSSSNEKKATDKPALPKVRIHQPAPLTNPPSGPAKVQVPTEKPAAAVPVALKPQSKATSDPVIRVPKLESKAPVPAGTKSSAQEEPSFKVIKPSAPPPPPPKQQEVQRVKPKLKVSSKPKPKPEAPSPSPATGGAGLKLSKPAPATEEPSSPPADHNQVTTASLASGGMPPPPPRISNPKPVSSSEVESPHALESTPVSCKKHVGTPSTGECLVCQTPICPKCMQIFGYLCGAQCRRIAEDRQMKVPECPEQMTTAENKEWAATRRTLLKWVALFLMLLGAWLYYALHLSRPHPIMTLTGGSNFTSGNALWIDDNQFVLLQGVELACYSVGQSLPIWTAQTPYGKEGGLGFGGSFLRSESMFITGDRIWLMSPTGAHSYLIADGSPGPLPQLNGTLHQWRHKGRYVLANGIRSDGTTPFVAKLDLVEGRWKSLQMDGPESSRNRTTGVQGPADAWIPRVASPGEFLDAGTAEVPEFQDLWIPAEDHWLEMEVQLREAKVVSVQAMRDNRGESVFNEKTSVSTSLRQAAEEVFNDMRSAESGGYVTEDQSTYEVVLRRHLGGGSGRYKATVTGPPRFYPAQSVDVLVAGKDLYLLNAANRLINQTKLSFPPTEALSSYMLEPPPSPCLETNQTLFFIDAGNVTAFSLPDGEVKWRLPTVGVSEIRYGKNHQLILNTTSASPDLLRFSKELQLDNPPEPIILVVDAQDGAIIREIPKLGGLDYVNGRYAYATQFSGGSALEAIMTQGKDLPDGHFRMFRIRPESGKVLWKYHQHGWPSLLAFRNNRILIEKEGQIQLLQYRSLF